MHLTTAQLARFERDGYLAPLEFRPAEEMKVLRPALDKALKCQPGLRGGDCWSARHQDCRLVYDICSSPSIVDPVASLLGPDVLIWNSVFINKEQGAREVPWHQDRDFLLLDPCVNVAVWLAIDDATVENGCLQVVAGSHGAYLPHIPRTHAYEFDATADIPDSAKKKAVNVELKAGQFILFHKQLLHHSAANASNKRRLGLAMRYTVPGVKVKTDSFFEGYCVYPVKGNDSIHANPIGVPPRD